MQQNAFSYTYNAGIGQEVLEIRNKYLPREESKLEELKRLDHLVQNAGVLQALCIGVAGCLVFGTGMCFAMGVIGNAMWPGILLGLVGAAGMIAAFPVYKMLFHKAKAKYAPRILELADELGVE